MEAARLLLAQRNRFEGAAGLPELLAEGPQRNQPGNHAESTVVTAARSLRVDVRPRSDHRATLAPGEPSPDAADRVAPHVEPCFGEPGGNLILGVDPLG